MLNSGPFKFDVEFVLYFCIYVIIRSKIDIVYALLTGSKVATSVIDLELYSIQITSTCVEFEEIWEVEYPIPVPAEASNLRNW